MKAYLINSARQTIIEVEYVRSEELNDMLGGYPTIAMRWQDSYLLVDDEGLLKPQDTFFRVEGQYQPLAGNGVVIGPDAYDEEGEYTGSADPEVTLDFVKRQVQFLTRVQFDAWVKANASEPSLVIHSSDGAQVHTKVLRRYGSINVPRRET